MLNKLRIIYLQTSYFDRIICLLHFKTYVVFVGSWTKVKATMVINVKFAFAQ